MSVHAHKCIFVPRMTTDHLTRATLCLLRLCGLSLFPPSQVADPLDWAGTSSLPGAGQGRPPPSTPPRAAAAPATNSPAKNPENALAPGLMLPAGCAGLGSVLGGGAEGATSPFGPPGSPPKAAAPMATSCASPISGAIGSQRNGSHLPGSAPLSPEPDGKQREHGGIDGSEWEKLAKEVAAVSVEDEVRCLPSLPLGVVGANSAPPSVGGETGRAGNDKDLRTITFLLCRYALRSARSQCTPTGHTHRVPCTPTIHTSQAQIGAEIV